MVREIGNGQGLYESFENMIGYILKVCARVLCESNG